MTLDKEFTDVKDANFKQQKNKKERFVGTIIFGRSTFSNKQETYFRLYLKVGIAFALKFNINDGEIHVYIGENFEENHISNEIFRYDVSTIEREKEYKLEIKFKKWSIDSLKINGEQIPNILDKALTHWDLVQFYSKSLKSGNYIEGISLAYTLIELELEMLLKQNGIHKDQIEEQKYLYDLSKLCLDKGFIDNPLHSKICTFNKTRKETIHSILQRSVSLREVKDACKKASSLMGEIQRNWLRIEVGEEKQA